MPQPSGGLLLYRRTEQGPEFFLVHMGGPFWAKKDEGAWSIPKGLYEAGEDALAAARRELREETGFTVDGEFRALGQFRQPSGKRIVAFLVEADCDADRIVSNTFAMEWPPRSGRQQEFPEVDRAGWFAPEEAIVKVTKGQRQIIEAAVRMLQAGL